MLWEELKLSGELGGAAGHRVTVDHTHCPVHSVNMIAPTIETLFVRAMIL